MGERGGEGVGKSPSVGGGNMLRLVESDCGVYKKKGGVKQIYMYIYILA